MGERFVRRAPPSPFPLFPPVQIQVFPPVQLQRDSPSAPLEPSCGQRRPTKKGPPPGELLPAAGPSCYLRGRQALPVPARHHHYSSPAADFHPRKRPPSRIVTTHQPRSPRSSQKVAPSCQVVVHRPGDWRDRRDRREEAQKVQEGAGAQTAREPHNWRARRPLHGLLSLTRIDQRAGLPQSAAFAPRTGRAQEEERWSSGIFKSMTI